MPALRGIDQVTIYELARVPRRVDQDHAAVGLPRRCSAQDRKERRDPRARADEPEVLGRRYFGQNQKSGRIVGVVERISRLQPRETR